MTDAVRILALIPARGGSKRLPGKNKKELGGKPLIVWSIDAVRGMARVCDVLVSTDELDIATIAKSSGALVPWLRPAELATDTATSIDVALHAVDWYESEYGVVDGVLLLQPTSPFRSRSSIERGISLFLDYGRSPVVSVSPTPAHPMWALKIEHGSLVPYLNEHGLSMRSQDLPLAYVPNGSFYLSAPSDLRRHRTFIAGGTQPLILDSEQEGLDIDTEWDFMMASAYLAASGGHAP